MKILIINNFHFHYEMFGYIIDFCKKYNHHLDILTGETNSLGILSWYESFFKYPYLQFLKKIQTDTKDIQNEKGESYDYIIYTTDDDMWVDIINSIIDINETNIYNKSICIEHSFQLRNPFCYHRIGIRNFIKRNIDYVYPCYPVIDYFEKKKYLSKSNTINITIIARLDKLKDLNTDYKKIMKLNKHILVNHICYCESENKEYYQQLIDKLFESIGTSENIFFHHNLLYEDIDTILKYTHYVYIPEYKESCKYDKTTGAIQLAFNYGCKIIFPEEGYKDAYQLSSPLEYISSPPVRLNKEPHKDVFDERNKLIKKRDNIFDNILNGGIIPQQFDNFSKISKIPKKIYQTWETSKINTPVLSCLLESVKSNNSDYEYNLFDSLERLDFIEKHFDKDVYDVYQRIVPGAFKADLWRYCVLYIEGGFYCDVDMICLNSFNLLLESDIDLVVPIDLNQNPREGKHNLFNAFIGIIPKHPIMKYCIDIIVDNVMNETWFNTDRLPLEFSGPGVLGKAVNRFLNRSERESLVGLEGIFDNNRIKIQFLKFTSEVETESFIDPNQCGKEFIKTADNKYIFQNRNGNLFIKNFYEKEIEKYKTVSWVSVLNQQQRPYV